MKRLLLLIGLLLAIAGCDAVLQTSHPLSAYQPSHYYLVPATMPADLAKANCGAQALGTATASLRPPGIQFSPAELQLWEHDGATPLDLLIRARLNGFIADLRQANWAQLEQAARNETRVLVEFDSTIEVWTPFGWFRRPRSQSVYHWGALTGVARDGSALLLAAPGGRDYIIKRDSFMRRWSRADDCLITIAPPP